MLIRIKIMSYGYSNIFGGGWFSNNNIIHVTIIGNGDNLISNPEMITFGDIKVKLPGFSPFT